MVWHSPTISFNQNVLRYCRERRSRNINVDWSRTYLDASAWFTNLGLEIFQYWCLHFAFHSTYNHKISFGIILFIYFHWYIEDWWQPNPFTISLIQNSLALIPSLSQLPSFICSECVFLALTGWFFILFYFFSWLLFKQLPPPVSLFFLFFLLILIFFIFSSLTPSSHSTASFFFPSSLLPFFSFLSSSSQHHQHGLVSTSPRITRALLTFQ